MGADRLRIPRRSRGLGSNRCSIRRNARARAFGVVLLAIPKKEPDTAQDGSTLRLRFDRGFFPIAPELRKLDVNVLPIIQLELEAERVLGQQQRLARSDRGGGFREVAGGFNRRFRDPAVAGRGGQRRLDPCRRSQGVGSRRPALRHGHRPRPHPLRQRRQRRHSLPSTANSPLRLPCHQRRRRESVGSGRKWRVDGVPVDFTNPEAIAGAASIQARSRTCLRKHGRTQ